MSIFLAKYRHWCVILTKQ